MRYGRSSSTTCGNDCPRVRRVTSLIRAWNFSRAFGAIRRSLPSFEMLRHLSCKRMRPRGSCRGLALRPRRNAMTMLIARHKVKAFATWKQSFDSHRTAQMAAGLTNPRLFRSADDASEVVIMFDVADIAKAKAFTTSPD